MSPTIECGLILATAYNAEFLALHMILTWEIRTEVLLFSSLSATRLDLALLEAMRSRRKCCDEVEELERNSTKP